MVLQEGLPVPEQSPRATGQVGHNSHPGPAPPSRPVPPQCCHPVAPPQCRSWLRRAQAAGSSAAMAMARPSAGGMQPLILMAPLQGDLQAQAAPALAAPCPHTPCHPPAPSSVRPCPAPPGPPVPYKAPLSIGLCPRCPLRLPLSSLPWTPQGPLPYKAESNGPYRALSPIGSSLEPLQSPLHCRVEPRAPIESPPL